MGYQHFFLFVVVISWCDFGYVYKAKKVYRVIWEAYNRSIKQYKILNVNKIGLTK